MPRREKGDAADPEDDHPPDERRETLSGRAARALVAKQDLQVPPGRFQRGGDAAIAAEGPHLDTAGGIQGRTGRILLPRPVLMLVGDLRAELRIDADIAVRPEESGDPPDPRFASEWGSRGWR